MLKQIEDGDARVTLFRIQEILTEYRATLITGILTDLQTYLQFKFYSKVEKEMQGALRDRLLDLSNSKVELDRYQGIVHEIENSTSYRIPSQEFFKEIDSLIEVVLNPVQLKLVR